MSILGSQAIVGACTSAPADATQIGFTRPTKSYRRAGGGHSPCSPLTITLMLKLLSSLPFLSLHFHVSPSILIFEFSDPFFVQAFILACMRTQNVKSMKDNPLHSKKCRKKTMNSVATKGKSIYNNKTLKEFHQRLNKKRSTEKSEWASE